MRSRRGRSVANTGHRVGRRGRLLSRDRGGQGQDKVDRYGLACSDKGTLVNPYSSEREMPHFDLRHKDGKIDPLAPFKVLAVMCHPSSHLSRERMVAHIQKETGQAKPRRRPFSPEEFMGEVRRVDRRAAVAGGVLLTMIQLQANGYRGSLNQALPLVAELLPKWQQPEGPSWSKDCHVGHHPHNRANMLSAYKEYRSAAHLWAAALHGQQHDRQDIWPGSTDTLPTFLAYAEAILDLACRLPSFVPGLRSAMSQSASWRFTVPELPQVTLDGLALNSEQLAIFDEHLDRKSLS